MDLKRVVVTGLGAITPLGNNVPHYWNALLNGVSGAAPITHFDASKFKTQFACEVKGYDSTLFFDRKEVRKYDLYAQYALVCAEEAFKDSGLDLEKINLEKAGVIWASGIGGLDTFLKEVTDYVKGDGTPRFNPFFIPKMIADIAAGHISIKYGFQGPNFTTTSACASSTNSMIDAFNYIRLGKADIIITGGSEAACNPAGVGGFNAMQALSQRNDDPKTASRPFDKDRDGFVLGEGGGAIILEEYEHAVKRGAKIYAEVAGGGMSADAHHMTAPHPEGRGAVLVMKNALEDAGMKPEDIDYINVHGTSTPLGDIAETQAIKKLFGEHAYKLNISATKSMTGHLLGATGAIEAIAIILAVKENKIPPTINHFTDDPDLDNKLNLTFHKTQEKVVNAALSNTFGFGGHNASVIVKKFVG
jgi:3-oxoacyl-[acyl-carrier-protein] synthase II